ncbi:MAG: hypothetical protein LRY55_02025 [Leadbetterella sp.]|nr:hypothetical protein [Leadbetterella sp.]
MGNYRYALDQQLNHQNNQRMTVVNPLGNAGSWLNFIRSVKSGGFLKDLNTGSSTLQERDTRSEIFRAGTQDN